MVSPSQSYSNLFIVTDLSLNPLKRRKGMKKFLTGTLIIFAMVVFQANALPIVGSSSGTFVNSVGGDAWVTGVGTSHFTWGEAYPDVSSLDFAGNSFSTNTEEVFSFGTLGYYNGTIYGGTDASAVDLAVQLSLTTPFNNQTFSYNLTLNNTPNTGTPWENADYVTFPNAFPTTTFNFSGVDYTLQLMGFGTVTPSGYTTVNEFHVLEQAGASAQLLGKITANIPNQNVPEPTSISLLLCSLVALSGFSFLRKK
jgi:large repetitive protein